jgi:hypothetical protein
VFPAARGVLMRGLAILIIAIILTLHATATIDGKIKNVDWLAASISGACPPISYKPTVTISNTGDEKARFYLTISIEDARGKERRSGCLTAQEILPGDTATVWPYPIELRLRYNRLELTLYANSCLNSNILDTDTYTIELKDCSTPSYSHKKLGGSM